MIKRISDVLRAVALAACVCLFLIPSFAVHGVGRSDDASETDYTVDERDAEDTYPLGDVDSSEFVTSADARAILRCCVSLEPLDRDALAYGDVDSDGKLTVADARLALRVSVGLRGAEYHAFSVKTVRKSSCVKEGEAEYRCRYCGLAGSLTVPADGHRYEVKEEKAAGCVAAGYKVNVCRVCGDKKTEDFRARGHDWVAATAKSPKHCSRCGEKVTGLTEVGGDLYYFNSDGSLPKGGTLINVAVDGKKVDRYFYNGKLDKDARLALTFGGSDYIVEDGVGRKVSDESDRTLFRAFGEVEKATTPGQTKEQKLWACYNYVQRTYSYTTPRSPNYLGMDWPIVYANDMFLRGRGNCFSYNAAFAYMAKAIGYENVYCCNSSGHGWAEIDGLVYDPDWQMTTSRRSYFGLSYYTKTDVNYRGAISAGYAWMHVKI